MSLRPKAFIPGLKVYEPGRPLEEVARELGLSDAAELTKLASNENPLGPSPAAVEAMRESAREMHLYPDGGGYYLKRALSDRLQVDPHSLVLGNGSNEIIELLGHVFLEPGRNIVMSECAFLIYKLVASSFQAETIAVPMRDFTHDLDAMLAAIDEHTQLVFVANPNNPTGTAVDPAALMSFIDAVPGHVLVVLDEAYVELMPDTLAPDGLDAVRAGKNLILLRTFSKAYGLAGLRVGYGIAPPAIVEWLARFRQPFNVNRMAQSAACAALHDEAFVQATRELVAAGRRFWETRCAEQGWSYVPSVANFMLIKVGRGRAAFEAMQRLGVVARPMDVYGLPGYLRITFGTAKENERAAEAMRAWMRDAGSAVANDGAE